MKIETSTGRAPSRPAIAASIGVLVVVWAGNFIAAKIGLLYLPPLAMASFRVVLAGVVMIPVYFSCLRLSAEAISWEVSAPRQTGAGRTGTATPQKGQNEAHYHPKGASATSG